MAPSLVSTLSSALLLSSTVSATQSYQLYDSYDSSNFLEKFGFFESDYSTGNYNDVDPTGGYVNYRSAADAEAAGLLKTVNGELYLGVDSENTLDAAGVGRSSVRIESKSRYKKGLFVADFSHFPKPACGAWPAFWTVGNPWPAAGEIDIVETWNEDGVNKVVIHTDSNVGECRIDGAGMTGKVSKPNCANFAPGQADNEGCAGLDSAAPFGSPEGGIYAMEWTDTAIRVWGFTHANAPADIAANPDPSAWGAPSFTTSACEADKVFGEAKMVMNIDFCGVAGQDGIWDQGGCQAKAAGATCKEWVAKNPAAFADVYFQLRSVKIYNLQEGAAAPSVSASQVASSTAVASSVAVSSTEAAVVSSTEAVAVSSTDAAVASSAAAVSSAPIVASSSAVPSEKPIDASSSAVASEKPVDATSAVPSEEPVDATSAIVPVKPTESGAAQTSAVAPEKPVETPGAGEDLTTRLATSTIYETSIETITSCAPTVTNCPARETPVVVTNVVAVTTTVCPVVDVPTQLTVSRTEVVTITSCPPSVPNCPVGSKTTVTSHEVVSTTVAVPVESYTKPAGDKPAGDKPAVTAPTVPAVPVGGGPITTYKTNIVTITSCAPTVTNCPVGSKTTIITSEVIPGTTAEGEKPVPVTTGAPEVPVVLTTYKTNIVTITSCPPSVTNCPVGKETTIVTSELITPTAPAPGVPAKPTEVPQNPPAPGTDKPVSPVAPGAEQPATTPGTGVPSNPGKEEPSAPGAGIPTAGIPSNPGKEEPSAPGASVPTAGVPSSPGKEEPSAPSSGIPTAGVPSNPGKEEPSAPGTGVPTAGVPVPGVTTSAQKPVVSTPAVGATTPAAQPTTLIVAPSSPYNGTLTTARTPLGTGTPCLGSSCPATTTGPVQAGAGKLSSGAFVLAAALAVFVF